MIHNEETKQAEGGVRNLVVLKGTLATDPESRVYSSGASMSRLLVTVRTEEPRPRTDVIPVTVWEPARSVREAVRGDKVDIVGQVHRRFWSDAEGRHSRVELVAVTADIGKPAPPQ